MKILVINGSPKGKASNTYKLTCAFLEGMRESFFQDAGGAGGAGKARGRQADRREAEEAGGREEMQVEEIQVNRLDIKPCLGCFGCWEKTPGKCCIQDDMQEVIQKLLWADITIWSFPLYYYTVPGGLKNLIDRQLPMELPFMTEREDGIGNGSHPSRYDMSGKKTVVISTCGFYTAEGNYDGVRSLFGHMCGKDQYTAIFCGQGELFRVAEVSAKTGEYLEHVKEAGREYAGGGISGQTWEALGRLLYPKEVFERMADASWGIDREKGEKETDALIFTRQMAALYRKESYSGKDRVLEMCYTDIGECYQILMGKEGSQVLTDTFRPFTTRIETPITLWRSIAAGEIRGDEAMMRQLYKVKGDFSLMLDWDKCFGAGDGQENGAGGAKGRKTGIHMPCKETNMLILLVPWIIFWSIAPINGFWGALSCLASCVLIPFIFYRHEKTIYDHLTNVLTAAFSIGLLAGMPGRVAVPLSYLAFGLMWAGSCLRKIPLTAHYSMNDYGGEKALENPLFIKTNRILTLLWGILYLLTPAWTYAIMGTDAGYLIGVVNSILPAGMGSFTRWFQKWYPAKVARGK